MEEIKNDLVNSYGYKLFNRGDAGLGYYLVLNDFGIFFGYDELLNDNEALLSKLEATKICFSIREKYSSKYIELLLNYYEAHNGNSLDKAIEAGNKFKNFVKEIELLHGVEENIFKHFMKK